MVVVDDVVEVVVVVVLMKAPIVVETGARNAPAEEPGIRPVSLTVIVGRRQLQVAYEIVLRDAETSSCLWRRQMAPTNGRNRRRRGRNCRGARW